MRKRGFFGFEDVSVVYIKIFFAIILVALIIFNIYEQVTRYKKRTTDCSLYKNMEIKGIVVEKYRADGSADPTLVILQNGWDKYKYDGGCASNAVNARVNDSVVKKPGEVDFIIFRNQYNVIKNSVGSSIKK